LNGRYLAIVTCRHYIIPLFRCRPPGLHKPYMRQGRKALYIHAAYVLVQIHKSRYRLVQLNGNLSAYPAHGETPLPLSGGKNPYRRHLYRAEIQRREEEKRETTKHPKVIPSSIYLNLLTHAPTTITPIACISAYVLLESSGW
jgi:hypothetical protein